MDKYNINLNTDFKNNKLTIAKLSSHFRKPSFCYKETWKYAIAVRKQNML